MIKAVVSLALISFLLGGCAMSSRIGDGSFHFIISIDKEEEKYE
jgi:hypothetical protein|tara:strand:- start:1377 stop:1508 length:132 start_codon:yes stop_codon:yes gene_type:complete